VTSEALYETICANLKKFHNGDHKMRTSEMYVKMAIFLITTVHTERLTKRQEWLNRIIICNCECLYARAYHADSAANKRPPNDLIWVGGWRLEFVSYRHVQTNTGQ
jgi:hypothetical protein